MRLARVTRSALKVEDAAPAAVKPQAFRCGSCGVRIPKLEKRPFICSYCAGDPNYGTDGLFAEMIADALEQFKAWLRRVHGKRLLPSGEAKMRARLSDRRNWGALPWEA